MSKDGFQHFKNNIKPCQNEVPEKKAWLAKTKPDCYNWVIQKVMKVSVHIWPWNRGTGWGIAHTTVSKTEESLYEKIKKLR